MLPLSDIAAGVLAGPLLAAGAAKLLTPPEALAWPIRKGVLRGPHGPRLVGAAEVTVAGGVVLLPGRVSTALAFGAYTLLAAAAQLLRGERCGCFGSARLAVVGSRQVGLNAAAAAASLALTAVAGAGHAPFVRGLTAILAALTTAGLVAVRDRLADVAARSADCEEQVAGVRLYVTDSCPACGALRQLLATIEPARLDALTTTVLDPDEPLPDEISGLGVPSAVPLSSTDEPVCAPVSGIGAVKALIDRIPIGASATSPVAASATSAR